jgi:hypothetical protein
MKQLEAMLDEWLVKKAPFQLPENARKGLVTALPWLTLLGGLLMLWAAWGLYSLITYVNPFVGLANELNAAYGLGYTSPVGFGPMVWVSLGLLAVEAVLFFIAFPALQAHKKSGWNILFWVTLLNVVQNLMSLIGYTSNFGAFLLSLLGSVVGLYLLFQVRSYYTGAPAAAASVGTMKTPKETPPASPADKPAETPASDDKKPEDKA